MFDSNYALLMERFPQIALEMPVVEKTEITKESLAPLKLKGAEALYFYGIGRGEAYFLSVDWLRAKASRRLIFLEDTLESISAFLHCEEAAEILQDNQVVLSRVSEIGNLAERFPVGSIEIAALPSRKRFKKLKEDLLQKTAFAHAIQLDRLHGYQPFQNFVRNLRHLPRSFYANKLAGSFSGIPAIICGAGPSLQQAIPHLRTLENKALLIAGGSTLAALSSQGINPHFGMAVDPNLEEYRRLKNSFAFEVPLLFSTRVFPAIFQTANGPFGYMRSGIGGVPEIWMEEELGLLDPLIGTHLSSDAISVTSICLAWAAFLGCNPILLSGVDLAYTSNKRYAPGVAEEALDLEEECGAADRIVKRKDRNGKPIFTAVRWLMESSAFSHFAKMHPETKFLNTTEGGIGFKKIPYCPLAEATAGFRELDGSLRSRVQDAINSSPMPANAQAVIDQKMAELKESLERIVGHLEICAGARAGSTPLAEMELSEEMAYSYLFYDAKSVIEKELDPNDPSEERWRRFLHLAKQYREVLRD